MPNAAAKSKGTRFIPQRFSIRVLLLLIAVAAGVVWWSAQPSGKGLSRHAANQVKLGMTTTQVDSLLRDPISGGGDGGNYFLTYRLQGSIWSGRDQFFTIHFKDRKVASWVYYRDPTEAKKLDDWDTRIVPITEMPINELLP
jgi:outer membrane protein assembly factor BamE (lipoprotein component of BamABCDE complex)